MRWNSIATLITSLLVMAALVLTAANLRNVLFPSLSEPDEWIEHWDAYGQSECRIGPKTAAVTVVVFADYQCPFCGELANELESIQRTYPQDVATVWRHMPLERFNSSNSAAKAALCAAEQGRFSPYHRALVDERENLGLGRWVQMANAAGIPNTDRFRLCIESAATDTILERDIIDGERLGVLARPTLLIGPARYNGVPPDLERLVRRAIKRSGSENTHSSPRR